ncbi:MAG: hypothetical protein OEX08_00245 [Candidatus Nomurabacteria bacterium]|nr:hypothetical protein [Candidatus Nomurabacteria bacterium]
MEKNKQKISSISEHGTPQPKHRSFGAVVAIIFIVVILIVGVLVMLQERSVIDLSQPETQFTSEAPDVSPLADIASDLDSFVVPEVNF